MRADVCAIATCAFVMLADQANAQTGLSAPGVSHELAVARAARYGEIRYGIDVTLTAPFEKLQGRMQLRFDTQVVDRDAILDWRPQHGARLSLIEVNGEPYDAPRIEHEHLILPSALLKRGANQIDLAFEAPIAGAGTALTRFHDPADQSDYVYSLFVPADASSVFPCFDQPDLKARFELQVTAPVDWRVIANASEQQTPEQPMSDEQALRRTRFTITEPISTYQFAFAAGPFAAIHDPESGTRMFVRRSRVERAQPEAAEVLRLARAGARWLADYFARAFPFGKYDLVLIPELAYGGMEHAGATFLREDSVLFPFQPSQADRLRRAQLIFHETAHQWFGDLVTMRWFDDLWLKEGFANFMAAKMSAALVPELDAWNAFRVSKLAAYRTDVTQGTTPIWQPLPNLNSAKSAYGNIVYSKAPALLRQAEFFLGEDVFRAAVRDFVARHAYAAADWRDLLGAFEGQSGRDLKEWGAAWVLRRGLPIVRLAWETDNAGRMHNAVISQRDVLGEGGVWPMRLQVALADANGVVERIPVSLETSSLPLPQLDGRRAPEFAYANAGDYGYGLFLLDAASRSFLLQGIGHVDDPFLRALLWDALWESVRAVELPPLAYLDAVMRELPKEHDEVTTSTLLSRLQVVFRWYLSDVQQAEIAPRLEQTLDAMMMRGHSVGLRIVSFRAYATLAWSAQARDQLKRLFSGSLAVPGVTLSSNDRFRIVRRLLVMGDVDAQSLLAQQAAADTSDEGRRQAYAARAAIGAAQVKRDMFAAFLADGELPERWIADSLAPFNAVEQEQLTIAWLAPALQALPELKRRHKIFFVNDWLAAFVGGQRSAQALATVERALQDERALPVDLRRKLLEVMDDLQRTVRIRARWATPS
jgi:aminopeptidase N